MDRRIVTGLQFAVVLIALSVLATDNCRAESKALDLVWEYETRGDLPQAIVVDRKQRPYLFAALKGGGLAVLQLAKPSDPPKEAARVPIRDLGLLDVMHLTQEGDILYLALGDFFAAKGAPAGLAIVSVKNPKAPQVLGTWSTPEPADGAAIVVVDGKHAYLGAMKQGVMVFDVSTPANIKHVTTVQPDVDFPRPNPSRVQHPNARGLAVAGKHLFVAYDAGGLRILDISKPGTPKEVGRYVNAGMGNKQQAYNNVVVDGELAYLAIDYAGLEIVNIKDPKKIRQVGWWNPWEAETLKNVWFNSPGHTNQIEFDRAGRLVYLSAGDSELQVVDVSNPRQPTLVSHYGAPKNERGAWGIALGDDTAYLTCIQAVVPFRGTWSGIVAVKRR